MKLYTAAVVAKWLDISERRVRQLRDQKVLTEARPGLYNLSDCVHRYIEFLRRDGTEDAAIDYNQERARLVRAKREKEELELRQQKGELHEAEEISALVTDMLMRFKARLMAIPAKQSPILSKKTDQTEIFSILKAAIDEALLELSDADSLFQGQQDTQEGKENGN